MPLIPTNVSLLSLFRQACYTFPLTCRVHPSSSRFRGRDHPDDGWGAQLSLTTTLYKPDNRRVSCWPRPRGGRSHGGANRGRGGDNNCGGGWWSPIRSRPQGAGAHRIGKCGWGGALRGRQWQGNNCSNTSLGVTTSPTTNTQEVGGSLSPSFINNPPEPLFVWKVGNLFLLLSLLQTLLFLQFAP